MAEGRGNTDWRTIEEAGDWLEIEKPVRNFAAIGRKQMQVSRTTTYGVPALEEGDSDDEDDVLSGEEENPGTPRPPRYGSNAIGLVLEILSSTGKIKPLLRLNQK